MDQGKPGRQLLRITHVSENIRALQPANTKSIVNVSTKLAFAVCRSKLLQVLHNLWKVQIPIFVKDSELVFIVQKAKVMECLQMLGQLLGALRAIAIWVQVNVILYEVASVLQVGVNWTAGAKQAREHLAEGSTSGSASQAHSLQEANVVRGGVRVDAQLAPFRYAILQNGLFRRKADVEFFA